MRHDMNTTDASKQKGELTPEPSPRADRENAGHRRLANDLIAVAANDCGETDVRLARVVTEAVALFRGQWPGYQPCRTGYHNLRHALEVALASARMLAGHNRAEPSAHIGADGYLLLTAAALFHDAGYILDRDDPDGMGGKYSFSHVERGCAMFERFAQRHEWPVEHRRAVVRMIEVTDFQTEPERRRFADAGQTWTLAAILGTADLIAQMADVDYLRNINELFDEFHEAYRLSPEIVAAKNIHRYTSADDLLAGTVDFYRRVVLPRLAALGDMHRYLGVFFATGRNPYMESIIANLSLIYRHDRGSRRRIGDVLRGLGLISDSDVEAALNRQALLCGGAPPAFGRRPEECKGLGAILVDMGAITPGSLSEGLLSQALPDESLASLGLDTVKSLLRFSVILHHIRHDTWALAQALEYIEDMLGCHGVCLILAGRHGDRRLAARTRKAARRPPPLLAEGDRKGLGEWVFRHQQAAMFNAEAEPAGRGGFGAPGAGMDRVRSILAAPVFGGGRVQAVVECYDKGDGTFTDNDRAVLTLAADILAAALPHAFADDNDTEESP